MVCILSRITVCCGIKIERKEDGVRETRLCGVDAESMASTNEVEIIEAEIAAKNSHMITLMEDNLFNIADFYLLLGNTWGFNFTFQEIEKQLHSAIIVSGGDDALFALAANVSHCDACGTMGVGLPKMLTCGGCKSFRYCCRNCQKKDWRNSHRLICTKENIRRELFKTTEACVNILTVSCIDWNTDVMNSENSHVQKKIKKSGCKDCVYVPVYEDKRVYYIPMPLKILRYAKSIAAKDPALKSELEKLHITSKSSDYLVLLVPTKGKNCSIMVKETHVLLPWASK